jgi:hypothetical protein
MYATGNLRRNSTPCFEWAGKEFGRIGSIECNDFYESTDVIQIE